MREEQRYDPPPFLFTGNPAVVTDQYVGGPVPFRSQEAAITEAEAYEGLDTEGILERAWSDFGPRLAMSSSFQTQSVPLLYMVSRVIPELPILFLDTGYHFPETLQFRDRLVEQWGLNVRTLRPLESGASSALRRDLEPYQQDPDLCCHVRKVEPLRRAMTDYNAMISGIRRDQTRVRAEAATLETRNGKGRVHPMLDWTESDVWNYISDHDLPVHPLYHQGYTSIGCAPCTRPVQIEGDTRSGRWAGKLKTECGLHLPAPDRSSEEKRSTGS